ncbi:COX15/CtaA family protein [Noviherbaspirillum sedimenti]|uniref:Heme A synthase n=1 Tax=Noviherbaspirillum sedimenti TaxID=2320865 RepID=A0A3A3G4X3_9BURK|nr:COX15/CtaA family protein [Noviherbaspirillum sedimenti]RJG03563.1 heme A synthase [Noviherbaspirillum sedimenti]
MLIQLAIKGMLVALLALAAVWASRDANKYRKLAWVTVFLTFDLIMFGAFTRLTDSGLGCPDWPGCYGHANPLQAHESIKAAEAAMPDGPVTVAKAWIEMLHRYFAMGVGVLIIALMAVAWRNWSRARRGNAGSVAARAMSPWLPSFLLLFVCVQGAFGAWTVTMKLQPVIVTIHLLLGMGLLALLAWLAARQSVHAPVVPAARGLRIPAALALVVLFCQIALGGWVSTNYAALACTDLPTCHGAWLPEMDFENGFTLWRHLGRTGDGDFLPFPALTAIHWAHRVFALVVAAILGWVAVRAMRIDGLRKTGTWLLAALVLQIVIGISTVYLSWPLALAVAHNGCAALLVLLLSMLNYKANLAAAPLTASRMTTHIAAA